jgi:hypothetical protein
MHNAAHAALIAVGYETPDAIIKTHHTLIAAFGKRAAHQTSPRAKVPLLCRSTKE